MKGYNCSVYGSISHRGRETGLSETGLHLGPELVNTTTFIWPIMMPARR